MLKSKFDLIDWKDELPRDIKEGKAATTSTTWTLHRMTRQPSFCHFFPLLFSLAERCLSIPVSNAWPDRGASALKHVKPRLRNRLKNEMLQALLQVSINGPAVESDACANIIQSAMAAWNRAKKRRNIPLSRGTTAVTQVQVAQVQVADAAVQADDNEQMETIEAEVQAATTAQNLLRIDLKMMTMQMILIMTLILILNTNRLKVFNSLYKCYFLMNNFLYYFEHFQAQFSNDLQMYTCRFVIVLL